MIGGSEGDWRRVRECHAESERIGVNESNWARVGLGEHLTMKKDSLETDKLK